MMLIHDRSLHIMPLLQRKPVFPLPNPDLQEIDPNTDVWYVPYTGEIFTSYEYAHALELMVLVTTWNASCGTTRDNGRVNILREMD
jgi:hypothetical protein